MKQLLERHPELENVIKFNDIKIYRVLSEEGKTEECWEKNDEGHFVDVTEREQLKEQIAAEQEELERLVKLEAKKLEKLQEAKDE